MKPDWFSYAVFLLSSCSVFIFLLFFGCRHPSHRLDHINPGNACPWSSFCETGWSMHSHTVKSLLSWCNDMFLLMGRLGQTRHTLLVSWVRVVHLPSCMILIYFFINKLLKSEKVNLKSLVKCMVFGLGSLVMPTNGFSHVAKLSPN